MNIKTLSITVIASAITLGCAIPVIKSYSDNSLVNGCDNAVEKDCLKIVDERPELRDRVDAGGQLIMQTIVDGRLRKGLNLNDNTSRIINSENKLTEDMQFTSVASATPTLSVGIDVRWFDGVRRRYIFQPDGSGWGFNPEADGNSSNFQWQYVNGHIKIVNEEGATTYLGGLGETLKDKLRQSAEMTRRANESERRAIEARRQEEIRQQELGARVIGDIFNGVLNGL